MEDGTTADPRSTWLRRLTWWVVVALAITEGLFDRVIEPWLRAGTAVGATVERYMPGVEAVAVGAMVWWTIHRIEGRQRRDSRYQEDLAALYRQAKAREQQLEALHEASVAIASDNGYPGVLSRIVAIAAQLGHARYGALAEFDDQERVVHFTSYGIPPEWSERGQTPPTHEGLLQRLSGTGPVRLDDVTRDPLFTGFPGGHPAFRTFLGVPIRWQGMLLGHLYLGGHEGETTFTGEEERLLQLFAMEAAVAIRRARLEAEASRTVRQAERRTIAMELHDGALQALYGVGIQLDQARRQGVTALAETMPIDVVVDAIKQAMGAIRDVLDSAGEERAANEPGRDLPASVAAAARLYGVRLAWSGLDALAALPADHARPLALCLCEAVANAARHGGAGQVWIAAKRGVGGNLLVRVHDDGGGPPADGLVEGHGLRHVRSRLASLGGDLTLSAQGPRGLVWRCRLPAPPASAGDGVAE